MTSSVIARSCHTRRREAEIARRPPASLRLSSDADGWSLLSPTGEPVFHATGVVGRRRCLEFARSRGVLTILT